MNQTTVSMNFKDNQARTRSIDLNEFTVQGGKYSYKSIKLITSIIQMAIVFSFSFSIPSSWRVSYIIQFLLDHFDPTLVDHLSSYLSTYPIRHPLWFSVSCGSQCSTVQRSSSHKCGQKSSYSAFNAVVAAFPQIFLDFLLSCMFMRHVPIIGASWKITLIVGLYTLNYIHQVREGAPPWTTFHLLPTYGT